MTTETMADLRLELRRKDAQLTAYREALERFTVYLPSIAGYPDEARVCIFPFDAHCPTVGDFRHALTVLQSLGPGKVLLDEHAAELADLCAFREACERPKTLDGAQCCDPVIDGELGALLREVKALRQRAEAAESALAKLQNERMPL